MLLHVNFVIFWLLMILLIIYGDAHELDPASNQLLNFKEKTQVPIGTMTVGTGAPVDSKDAGSTLNKNLFTNKHFLDSISHLVRERIPVRTVHPKGAGAFGYFVVTHDISDKCKADFLSKVGKKTPIAVRLSMGVTERGGSDLTREARGFAVKFYTEKGIFDIAGFHIPVFVNKDPLFFPSFVHVVRKNPATDFADPNMLWDFITLRPESIFFFLMVFSDLGIPDGYRHMPGFSIHTYVIYNAVGTRSYVRFHFIPLFGIKTLNSTEAARLGASDPDYSARDLYDAIARGDCPTWEVSIQLMSEDDVKNVTFNPFDITKVVPLSQFPLIPLGKIVLNINPVNYFAEVEQMAFCPANLVSGILGSPDKVFEARRFSYRDAQRYRLGSNFDNIAVNCPYRSKVLNYNRDGSPPVESNGYDAPNYYPNSFNGPVPYTEENRPCLPNIFEAEANNFEQAREYYTNQITPEERNRLIQNIVNNLCRAVNFLQDRAIQAFCKVDCDLANRVARELKKNNCKH